MREATHDIDETHDRTKRSWVRSANEPASDFPIQNLPFGIFSPPGGAPRGGIAIGDRILDIAAASSSLGEAASAAARAASRSTLNDVMALPRMHARALRLAASALLDEHSPPRPELLHDQAACSLHLPAAIGDYTDFYAGIHHAVAASAIMRPGQGLPANYKWVPIGYHGRASSVRASGAPVRRPNGQRRPDPAQPPVFGPSTLLDLELELGLLMGGGNPPGEPIPIMRAGDAIFGICLLNDWSARDIQAWEVAPLGPFLAKNFCTTISPWVVTSDALAPFRAPAFARPEGDPHPLPYLHDDADQAQGGLDIALSVSLLTARMRDAGDAPVPIIRSNARHLYWTPAQMVAHHSSGGCNLMPGDLLGTGTISGPMPDQLSSLMELTRHGAEPFRLPNGEQRAYLEDGDEVLLTARCERDGFVPIGFGACAGIVTSALQ